MKTLEKSFILLTRKALMHEAQLKYGLSKTQIAEIFNVDKSTVGRVLASKKKLTLKELRLMADLI